MGLRQILNYVMKGGIMLDKNLIDEILREIGLEHIDEDETDRQ